MAGKDAGMLNGKDPEITVIVPVYNVAGYIDRCLQSITDQTFPDFEVLLIDDGSDDGSSDICDRWGKTDRRFRVIHKENGGVSSARNRGIEEARGEWLAFADPDDWLDPEYLEKLYRAAKDAGADFAECDIWRYDDRTGKKIHRSCGGTMGIAWTPEEHMKYGSTATYKSVSRRTLWIDNDIRLPDCAFESPAVYALILAVAEKTVNIPEPLYYYRRFRPQSLIETGYARKDGSANNTLGIEAMGHLLSEFKRLGLYDRYSRILKGTVVYRLSDILATQFYRKTPEDFRETVENFRAFLRETYPEPDGGPAGCAAGYLLFGGYNLNRILAHMDILQDPYCRFNFSSLISIADPEASGIRIRHGNRYRQMMVQREEDGAFWDILEEVRPRYLFIDLIEERFDILERDGRLVTASDAREGADEGGCEGECIRRDSCRCAELFRDRCGKWLGRIRSISPDTRIVVIENLLCTSYGTRDGLQPYADAEEIRKMNGLLEKMYAEVYRACPDAVRISPREEETLDGWLFTDEKYEYGAIPSHLNEIANRKIAKIIEKRLADDAPR